MTKASMAIVLVCAAVCVPACSKKTEQGAGEGTEEPSAASAEAADSKAGATNEKTKAQTDDDGGSKCKKFFAELCGGEPCEEAEEFYNETAGDSPEMTPKVKEDACKAILESPRALEAWKKNYEESQQEG